MTIISFIELVTLNVVMGLTFTDRIISSAGCFTPFSMTELVGEVITIL